MSPVFPWRISQRLPVLFHPTRNPQQYSRYIPSTYRHYSDASSKPAGSIKEATREADKQSVEEVKPKKKTQAELDAEVMAKLQGHDSEGGAAGIEYEDGKPTSMKRSVRNNMFRYI